MPPASALLRARASERWQQQSGKTDNGESAHAALRPVQRRQKNGKTDDGGSAHAALPADALTRTYVVYRGGREELLVAVPG